MNAAVIYSSQQGSTRRYAQVIARALHAQLMESKAVKPAQLDGFDTLVFGGGVMAGNIAGAALLKKNASRWSGKRIAVFAVGLSDPGEPGLPRKLLEQNLPSSLWESVGVWFFRGGLDVDKLGWLQKKMIGMVGKQILHKPEGERSQAEQDMLAAQSGPVDYTDLAAIEPLVAWCSQGG